MGYTTDFDGSFTLDQQLLPEQAAYLKKFSETRRMKRDAASAEARPDPWRQAVGLPIGPDGAYFVAGDGFRGQDSDASVTDDNEPPSGQPGLWCTWTVDEDGCEIRHNGVEKFYDYVEWIVYIIEHFLKPWGRSLNGEIVWQGEEESDVGMIVIENNVVSTKSGKFA